MGPRLCLAETVLAPELKSRAEVWVDPLYVRHRPPGLSSQAFQGLRGQGPQSEPCGLFCLLAGLCHLTAVRGQHSLYFMRLGPFSRAGGSLLEFLHLPWE